MAAWSGVVVDTGRLTISISSPQPNVVALGIPISFTKAICTMVVRAGAVVAVVGTGVAVAVGLIVLLGVIVFTGALIGPVQALSKRGRARKAKDNFIKRAVMYIRRVVSTRSTKIATSEHGVMV